MLVKKLSFLLLLMILLSPVLSQAQIVQNQLQTDSLQKLPKEEKKVDKKWYDNFSIRGYSQVRYNRLLETNENLGCEQCDRSWGKDGGFFIRRMRVIFSGQINKNVYQKTVHNRI